MKTEPRCFAGHEGDDDVFAGDGNDRVYLEFGDDTGDGGLGVDTIIFYQAQVTANLTTGTASGEGTDVFGGFEHLAGSQYWDVLTGNARPNTIKANAGADTVYGLDGSDKLYGLEANDYLRGAPVTTTSTEERVPTRASRTPARGPSNRVNALKSGGLNA